MLDLAAVILGRPPQSQAGGKRQRSFRSIGCGSMLQ